MNIEIPRLQSEESAPRQTPEEKLEVLYAEVQRLKQPPYDMLDRSLVEKLILNIQANIAELKTEYPELNN